MVKLKGEPERTKVEHIAAKVEVGVSFAIAASEAQLVATLGLASGLAADVQAHWDLSGTCNRHEGLVVADLDEARLVDLVVDLEPDLSWDVRERGEPLDGSLDTRLGHGLECGRVRAENRRHFGACLGVGVGGRAGR